MQRNIVVGWKDKRRGRYEYDLNRRLDEQEARIHAATHLSSEAARKAALAVVAESSGGDFELDLELV